MSTCHMFCVLSILLFTPHVQQSKGLCGVFEDRCTLNKIDGELHATLTFSLNTTHTNDTCSTYSVAAVKATFPYYDIICQIRVQPDTGLCGLTSGCTCNSESREFSVTRKMNAKHTEQWALVGKVGNGQPAKKMVVNINEECK
ncbi:hypothetical protein V1264_006899 [Littorina saxatilis]|uniref:Secreted protein n=1 Tax=Littorina saxatilis TaxID=31220 RepID=A0AAN9AYM2_9CAEN